MQGQDLGSYHWLDDGLLDLNFLGVTETHLNRTWEWSHQEKHPLMPSGHTARQNPDNCQILHPGDRHVGNYDNGGPSSSGKCGFQDLGEFSIGDTENNSYHITTAVERLGNYKHDEKKSKLFLKQETKDCQQLSNIDTWQALPDDDIFDNGGFHSYHKFETTDVHNPPVHTRSVSLLSDDTDGKMNTKSLSEKGNDFDQWGSPDLEEWDSEVTSCSGGTSFFSGFDGDSYMDSDTMSDFSKSIEHFPRSAALQEIRTTWKRDAMDKPCLTINIGQGLHGSNFISPRCKSVDSTLGVPHGVSSYCKSSTLGTKGVGFNSSICDDGSNFFKSQSGTVSQFEFSGNLSGRKDVGQEEYKPAFFGPIQKDPPSQCRPNLFDKLDVKNLQRSRHQSLPNETSDNLLSSILSFSMTPDFNKSCSSYTHWMQSKLNEPTTFETDKADAHGKLCQAPARIIPSNPCDINMDPSGNDLGFSMPNEVTALPPAKVNIGRNYENAQMQKGTSQSYDGNKRTNNQGWLGKLHEIPCYDESLTNPRRTTIPSNADINFSEEKPPDTSSVPISGEMSLLKNGHTETKRDSNLPQELMGNLPSPKMELPSRSDGIEVIPSTSSDDHNQLPYSPLKSVDMDHLDKSLKEAFQESKRTGSMMPMIKQELKMKIMLKRCRQGKDDIKEDATPTPVFELTEEEKEKRKKKLERNRLAASKCRKRKLVKKQKIDQELKDEEDKNIMLKKELQRLMTVKNGYLIKLIELGIL